MDGLLREYFRQERRHERHPPGHLLAVEIELNNRPSHVLGHRTPTESICVATLTRTRPAADNAQARPSVISDLLGSWQALHRGQGATEILEQAVR
jgi:hypothetical protein